MDRNRNSIKTLDERIETDLKTLYGNGLKELIEKFNQCKIKEAEDLSKALFGKPGELSAHGLPGYFTGNRAARTVMVMLNPGSDVATNDNPQITKALLEKLKISDTSEKDFIETYKEGNGKFGEYDISRKEKEAKNKGEKIKLDNFDLKQAAFLKHWKDSGVVIDDPFPQKDDVEGRKKAIKNVLMGKLQLELVPYASRKFEKIEPEKYEYLFPYVETLIDEIFSQYNIWRGNRYVIFCSAFFEKLFTNYKSNSNDIDIDIDINPENKTVTDLYSYDGGGKFPVQNEKKPFNASCMPIKIHYKNKDMKAIIAHTFPNQALPNAFNLMEKYGYFCYDTYKNSNI